MPQTTLYPRMPKWPYWKGPLPPAAGAPVVKYAPFAGAIGPVAVGTVLNCTMGEWTNEPTSYSYHWMRGGSFISGATTAGYTTTAEDAGEEVRCELTASNSIGPSTSYSNKVLVEGAVKTGKTAGKTKTAKQETFDAARETVEAAQETVRKAEF